MKRILVTLFILLIASHYFYSNAQNKEDKKKEKKVVIKIDKEENGKITKIDTTIILKEGEDPSVVLEKYGIKSDKNMKHKKTFDIKIDEGDTTITNKKEKMVWVTVDDENDSIKHNSNKTKVIIISDGDDEEMMHFENGNVMIFKEKGGKKIKHIKEFKKEGKMDSIHSTTKVFVLSDDDENINHMMIHGNDMDYKVIKGDGDDSDSTIVVIKKYKNGKESTDTKKIIKKKKEKMVMIKVLDVEKDDLANLKLKENYKKLDAKDFNISITNEKMTINFELKEKSNTTVKMIDKTGKAIFTDDQIQFQGKYSKETEALNGEFYLQINQGNKYFIRKVSIEIK